MTSIRWENLKKNAIKCRLEIKIDKTEYIVVERAGNENYVFEKEEVVYSWLI